MVPTSFLSRYTYTCTRVSEMLNAAAVDTYYYEERCENMCTNTAPASALHLFGPELSAGI